MKKLNFAIDYDQTYTANPKLIEMIMSTIIAMGHTVYVVTARNPVLDTIKIGFPRGVSVVYCDGVAKRHVMENQKGIKIDIWMDDKPESVDVNSDAPFDALTEWRKNRVELWDETGTDRTKPAPIYADLFKTPQRKTTSPWQTLKKTN